MLTVSKMTSACLVASIPLLQIASAGDFIAAVPVSNDGSERRNFEQYAFMEYDDLTIYNEKDPPVSGAYLFVMIQNTFYTFKRSCIADEPQHKWREHLLYATLELNKVQVNMGEGNKWEVHEWDRPDSTEDYVDYSMWLQKIQQGQGRLRDVHDTLANTEVEKNFEKRKVPVSEGGRVRRNFVWNPQKEFRYENNDLLFYEDILDWDQPDNDRYLFIKHKGKCYIYPRKQFGKMDDWRVEFEMHMRFGWIYLEVEQTGEETWEVVDRYRCKSYYVDHAKYEEERYLYQWDDTSSPIRA